MTRIAPLKIAQARALCAEHGWGAWVFLARETPLQADPLLELILDGGLTWLSALIITPDHAEAVVGNYDADPLLASRDWDRVTGYVEDFAPAFLAALPSGPIAVNFSEEDSSADGLTYGLYCRLRELLPDREIVSSEPAAQRLRGQKLPEEVARIRSAISAGDGIFARLPALFERGPSEREVYDQVHAWAREEGLGFSWDPEGDPIVNHGPDSMIGHGIPNAALFAAPGQILHVDLGVVKDGYSSDIQRVWLAAAAGDEAIPEDVRHAFAAVHQAITAGAEVLRPGVLGREVDAAARASLVASGWPEYRHAFGHQVGRRAHDGGAVLGPAWPRYGRTVETPIREGEIYTLELGVTVPGRGYLGLEEMALVVEGGIEWLSERQSAITIVPIS